VHGTITANYQLENTMRFLTGALLLMAISTSIAADDTILDQDFRRLASDEVVNLAEEYDGKVLLIVNTASKCGNTPQYDGLEKLYQQYGDNGLVVLGFPSNDFFGQEPGTEGHREGRRGAPVLRRPGRRGRHLPDVELPQVSRRP
jgi:hypothetical protein